jgi:hypothetical protein
MFYFEIISMEIDINLAASCFKDRNSFLSEQKFSVFYRGLGLQKTFFKDISKILSSVCFRA